MLNIVTIGCHFCISLTGGNLNVRQEFMNNLLIINFKILIPGEIAPQLFGYTTATNTEKTIPS